MKRIIIILIVVLLGLTGWWVYNHYDKVFNHDYHSKIYTPEKYLKLKDSLRAGRDTLADLYRAADIPSTRRFVMTRARGEFTKAVTEKIFPFWYGTDWAYHGTTEVPGQGSIACGYFVTTVLRDAGAKIERSKLAQCASEEMIKTLVEAKNIKRFSGVSILEFEKAVKEWGDGVYVVGLDNHTGFITCTNGEVKFVHSGGGVPPRVLVQSPADAKLLANSKYRVLAKLTASESFLKKWVTGEKFK